MLLLMVILSGCMTKNYNANYLDLPIMPIAGAKVATELKAVCTDQTCNNLNKWLNELYLFKVEYEIIRLNYNHPRK